MKTNVYVIFDKVADEVVLCSMCKTDGLFVRQNLPYVSKLNPAYERDLEIRHIGYYVDSTCSLEPCDARIVEWTAYQHPEESQPDIHATALVTDLTN